MTLNTTESKNTNSDILIVCPSWVGDMVMAHSLFQILAEQNKAGQLDILAPQWNAQLASRMPEVRDAIDGGKLEMIPHRYRERVRRYLLWLQKNSK